MSLTANTYKQILRQGTQAQYEALSTKDNDLLYFCTDTGKLYKGSVDFSNSLNIVSSTPAALSMLPGRVYVVVSDGVFGGAYVKNGTASVQIAKGFDEADATATTISASSTDTVVPTSKNVYLFGQALKEEIEEGTDLVHDVYANTGSTPAAKIDVVSGSGDSESIKTVTVPGVVISASISGDTLTFTKSTGAADTITITHPDTGVTELAVSASKAAINWTDADGDHDTAIKGVVISAEAGDGAAQIDIETSTDVVDGTSSSTITVPGVVTGGSISGSTITLAKSTGAADTIEIPAFASPYVADVETGNVDGQLLVTGANGLDSHAAEVPGVMTGITAGSQAGQLTLDGTDKTVGDWGTVTVPGVVATVADKSTADAVFTVTPTTGAAYDVTLTGVVKTPTWNSTSRILTLPVSGLADPIVVNIGKDIFLKEGYYDTDTQEIVLILNNPEETEIRVAVGDLIPIYTGGNTTTATVSVNNKVITTNVKIDQHSGNAITVANDDTGLQNGGLRVDLSDYALQEDLDETNANVAANATNIATNAANIAALALATTAWGSFT